MITASSLDRVIECPASEVLPHIYRSSGFAEAGTARHLYLEHVGKIGASAALELVPAEHREMCEAIDLEGLPTNLASEVTFAYDYMTGEARELGRWLARDYSACGPTEIAGTIDVLGVSDDRVYIGDYKGHALVKAKDNAQLLFAAMCATEVYDRNVATVEIINVRGGDNWRSKATVDVFDLGAFAIRLASTMRRVDDLRSGAPVEVTEGPHCKYCPAFDSCPAKVSLLREMVAGDGAMISITEDNATDAYAKYLAMSAMLAKVKAAIYAYASARPIQIDDGRVFGLRTKLGNESIDGDVAYGQIRTILGQGAADIAVERKATKAGIARAVKYAKTQGNLPESLKALTERVMAGIDEGNGLSRKEKTVIDEHKKELTA